MGQLFLSEFLVIYGLGFSDEMDDTERCVTVAVWMCCARNDFDFIFIFTTNNVLIEACFLYLFQARSYILMVSSSFISSILANQK